MATLVSLKGEYYLKLFYRKFCKALVMSKKKLILMMTSTQFVETTIAVDDNSPYQNWTSPNNYNSFSAVIPGSNDN